MEYYRDTWNRSLDPGVKLNVVVVGAGIAGLMTGIALKKSGHNVVILEQVSDIKEVGAGIQLAPNMTRIFGRFGILEKILKHTNLMEKNSLRRWKNNEELGTAPLMPVIAQRYGAPLGVIHRGDLQRVLLESAKDVGCDIRTGQKVVQADKDFEPRVQVSSGEWVEGDIIIAADGIKSKLRAQIAAHHNDHDRSIPTGDSAYRILIPKEKLEHDEESLALLNQNVGMRWMGPGGHIMAYPIKNNTVYNMVLLHPDKGQNDKEESWTRQGSKKEMMDFYKEWCPPVRNLLSYAPEGEVLEWTLNSHKPLPSWHEKKVVLIGDACHPMLPYVAQGAAQAIEDAAVLACVLCKSPDDLMLAIMIYEQIRKARGEAVQSSATTTRRALHLPDGREQEERDRKIKDASAGKGDNPDLWADTAFQQFIWGTDIMEEAFVKWPEWKARAEGTHLHALGALYI